MDKKLYSYKGQYIALTQQQIAVAFNELEKSLRTPAFTYVEQRAFPSQVEEIKTSWPEGEIKTFIRTKAREVAGKGNAITMAHVRKAILATNEQLAQIRALASERSIESELAYIAAETALATLFRRAPDSTANPNSVPSAKQYKENGPLIRVKPSITTSNLFVNDGEVESASIFVLALFNGALKVAYLLGYATKDMVKAVVAEKGQNYKQIPLGKLRPMSMLYAECGLTELPAGISMEVLPDPKALPVVAQKELQSMIPKAQGTSGDFDEFAELGITAPAPKQTAAVPAPAPAAPQSVVVQPAAPPVAPSVAAPATATADLGDL